MMITASPVRLLGVMMVCCGPVVAPPLLAAPAAPVATALKTESFDKDPSWEGFQNHVVPAPRKRWGLTVEQDFGYSATHFAGKEPGEIGGRVWRSATRASYATPIPTKTLDDKLSASGTFVLTETNGSSGAFFGWFADPLDGRRNTLGFHFAGQGAGARITLQLVTDMNQACGTKVTTWIVDKTKPSGERKNNPPEVKNDGTRYNWVLNYDPQANDGNGQIQFTVRSDSPQPAAFETVTHTVDLPEGYKQQGTAFNRFGLTNSAKPGNPLSIYFDDLRYDGQTQDFSSNDAGWVGSGNRVSFEDREQVGAHDFGFSRTNYAEGRAAGELGGLMWRAGDYGYYADRVGPLTLEDRLEASGKVVLAVGSPDSGMYLGWFNSAEKEYAPTQAGHFVGVKVGGPTRAGHYFLPAYATAQTARPEQGTRQNPPNISVGPSKGPQLVPHQVYPWKLVYDPEANDGKGLITLTLGDETITRSLHDGDKATGATLDRFGLFTPHVGGSFVKIYFDDMTYTTADSLSH